MTASSTKPTRPQQPELFQSVVTPNGVNFRPGNVARPGQHPAIKAQHKGEEETLDERFAKWIEANPKVLEVFIRRALQYQAEGRKKVGAKRIVEDMRWDEQLWTAGDPFKINNLFVSRLSRLAVTRQPGLAGFFEFRELQS